MTDSGSVGAPGADAWPTDISYDPERRSLTVVFDNGETHALPAEYLRVESPSAEVQGHGPDQKVIVPGKANVGLTDIEPVGNYAVRLTFDDGHDTGLYTWAYLLELGREHDQRWANYEAALAAANLSRTP